jgi:Tol biopolymer transport system component
MTITGVAAGNANITVTAADPTHAPVMIVFQVTVSTPPAPNNAPTIGAIPAQTVATGASVNVTITANDADNDPLTFSAVLADNTLATTSFAGNVLTINGVKAGTTQVTVIVGDGKTTASTAFNLTVTGGAAPSPGSPSGGQNNLVSQGTQNPPRPDLAQFGLLTLPMDGQNIAAVFQATAGEGQQVAIYVLNGDQFRQLFEGATESNLFPTLDPTGALIAFLTVDAQGAATLRVHRLEQNASLPLLTGTPELSIGLYPPAWSPDGKQILLTLVDGNGVMGIYSLQIRDPLNIPPPALVVPNANTAAFAPNGNYIAFELIGPAGERNIYVMVPDKPNTVQPVTQQPVGSDCTDPMFSADSLALFFTCMVDGQPQIFRYDVQGVNQLNLGVAMADNPAPGPGDGFLAFDDGTTIYYGYDTGSNVAAMLRLENLNATNIRWVTLADIQ